MKLKAKLRSWSSIVGTGVHLIGPDGRMEAQIAFINHDNCTMCGRPINGDPDMDGHYWTKHARYIDLCDDCGDDMEIER